MDTLRKSSCKTAFAVRHCVSLCAQLFFRTFFQQALSTQSRNKDVFRRPAALSADRVGIRCFFCVATSDRIHLRVRRRREDDLWRDSGVRRRGNARAVSGTSTGRREIRAGNHFSGPRSRHREGADSGQPDVPRRGEQGSAEDHLVQFAKPFFSSLRLFRAASTLRARSR